MALNPLFLHAINKYRDTNGNSINMSINVDVDPIDIKILYTLIRDARTKIKDIAIDCHIAPTTVIERINRLKKAGVITGAALTINLSETSPFYSGSIEIENIKNEEAEQIAIILKKITIILVKSYTTGKSNFNMFFVTKKEIDIDNLKTVLSKYSKSGKIRASIWKKSYLLYDNLKIDPG